MGKAGLKINLLTGDVPEKAVTTHPEIVRAMIHQVKSSGGIPQVGDCGGSEGASNRNRYFAACRSSGIMQVCEEEGTEILHLSAESIDAKNTSGRYLPCTRNILVFDKDTQNYLFLPRQIKSKKSY